MSKHDESRRAFLIGTAVGAGAVAGAGLVPDALAQTQAQHNAADAAATTAQAQAHGPGHGAFLNDDDAATVAAFAERLMPGAPGKPGARDAGVLNYIDLALAININWSKRTGQPQLASISHEALKDSPRAKDSCGRWWSTL